MNLQAHFEVRHNTSSVDDPNEIYDFLCDWKPFTVQYVSVVLYFLIR